MPIATREARTALPPPEASLRILFASYVANDPHSGMGRWTHCAANALGAEGHLVTTWFSDAFAGLARTGRWAVLAFPLALAARVWRHRRDFDALVVHEPGALWLGIMRRIGLPIPPVLVMSHGIESRAFRDLLRAAEHGLAVISRGTRLKTPLFRLSQTDAAIRLADGLLCLSSYDRDYAVSELRCDADRIHRFVNGVSHEFFAPARPPGRRVLFVGGWTDDRKGRRILPRVWRTVRARVPDATLTLLGTGVRPSEVLPWFDEADRAALAVYPRVADTEAVAGIFAAHDVFFFPTLAEGSPLSLLEAMASGLVSVTSRVGGIPDIVTDRTDGLLFDPLDVEAAANALSLALTDDSLRRRLAAAARRRAGECTWAAAGAAIARAIRATVGPSQPRSTEV